MIALRPIALAAPLASLVICQLMLLALGTLGARSTLQEIREQPSAHALEVTNPFSFVPLISHMYGCIFLFESTFGFVTSLQRGQLLPVHYALIGVLLVGLAGVTRLFPGDDEPRGGRAEAHEHVGTTLPAEAGKYSRAFTEDTLFVWCSLTPPATSRFACSPLVPSRFMPSCSPSLRAWVRATPLAPSSSPRRVPRFPRAVPLSARRCMVS